MSSQPPTDVYPKGLATEEELLQVTTLLYYLHETNPVTGLIRDKTDPAAPASIAAVGLGLASTPILVERGVIAREFAPEFVRRLCASCAIARRDPSRMRPAIGASTTISST